MTRRYCEGKERESRNDVYDRKSFYDIALLALHTAHCTLHKSVVRVEHENGRNCCFLMLSTLSLFS